MKLFATLKVAGRALRAHGGKTNVAEVVVAASETHNRIASIICLKVVTGVDPMHQKVEVDSL